MFEVLILEDEEYNLEFLKKIINQIPEVSGVYATSSADEAIALAQNHKPECVLLDIELSPGGSNGLTVAKSIFSHNRDCFIVFITGYAKYALQSFSVHPYDYIVKPINKAKLRALIKELSGKVHQHKFNTSGVIVFKGKGEVYQIHKDEIVYIEKFGNIAHVYTGNEILKVHQSLDEIQSELNGDFFRSHKSYLINLNKIRKVTKNRNRSYKVEFYDYDQTAMMSRYRYEDYLRVITNYSSIEKM